MLHALSLSVAMGMKNAVRMRRTVVSSVTCLALWFFSTLSHKWHDSQKICIERKTCVWNFCKFLSEKFLIVRIIQQVTVIYLGLPVKHTLSL